jgi:hypothetical protein
MVHPQIINLLTDSVIAIDGVSVINDTTQIEMSLAPWSGALIHVDIDLFDITAGSAVSQIDEVVMTYQSASDVWTLPIASIVASLIDRHKYIANIKEGSTTPSGPAGMRGFKLQDFSVDNDSFEDTIMRLPFQVEIGTPSYMKWYTANDWVTEKFRAEIYQGGTGTTAATDPSKVTHRGPIIPAP